jgi:hypothetical protein
MILNNVPLPALIGPLKWVHDQARCRKTGDWKFTLESLLQIFLKQAQ